MKHPLHESPSAERDVMDQARYIYQRNPAAGLAFLDAVADVYERLMETPELGSLCGFPDAQFSDIRACSIKGFRNYVVYYRFNAQQLEVVRITRGSQDITKLLSP